MLYRKIEKQIQIHLSSDTKKILLVDGARQVGKTYIIRHVGQKLFENFIEVNMVEDAADVSKYDTENKLKTRRIYDLIPSNMENKKKRVIAQNIENKKEKPLAITKMNLII